MNAAGSPGGPAVIALSHALGLEVIACDTDDSCAAATLADAYFTDEPTVTPGYANNLIQRAVDHHAKWLLPNSGIQALARAKIGAPIHVLVSDVTTADLCSDKALLYEALGSRLAPAQWVVSSVDDLEKLIASRSVGSLTIKPRTGEGSRGFYRVVDDLTTQEISGARTRTRIPATDLLRQLRSAGTDPSEFVCTEYLPGPEVTIVGCIDDHDVELIPLERQQPGADGLSTLNQVRPRSLVEQVFGQLMNVLPGLKYYIDVQVKQHVDGSWRVIDVNPRISGLISCCTAFGSPQVPSQEQTFPHLLPPTPQTDSIVRLYHDAVLVQATAAN
jgi:carbamoylphosphate synthase large subunit